MDGSSVIPVPVIGAQRDIRWADGLRGIAALFVVTSHISRAFAPTLLDPQRGYDARPTLFHLPFLRLPAQGPPWVALFFVLTGYVNAMRPIKQARSGNTTAAFENLASSSLRRTARLVLPTTVATVASWFVCQLGGYRLAKACEADWIRYSSPEPSSGAIAAVTSLLRNIFTTWASGSNQYDPVQWTLTFLLKASMLIYMVLLATVRTTSFYRMLVFLGMYAFSWASGDSLVGLNIYIGAFLAEFTLLSPVAEYAKSHSPLKTAIPWVLVMFGLYLCGYPETHAEWSGWSNQLLKVGILIFPSGSEIWRAWPTVGTSLIILGIIGSSFFQRLLSQPRIIWLGGLSLPIYLLHAPLLRTVLTWMLFGFTRPKQYSDTDDDGHTRTWESVPVPESIWAYVFALPLFFGVLLTLCHLWNLYVDPWCAWATKRMEDIMVGEERVFSRV